MFKDFKAVPIFLIAFAILMRLLPHPANFAPITAISLFAGVYLDRKWAFAILLASLLISDLFLGFYGLEMFLVYGSFALVILIGEKIKNHKNISTVFLGAVLGSILFYLITNFGVWALTSMYPKDFSGLIQSYIAAIPFYRNSFLGDLFYAGLFFGGYELVKILSHKFISKKYLQILF